MARTKNLTPPPPLDDDENDPAVREFYEGFRVRMKQQRKKAKLTQEVLSEFVGVSWASYKHMEGKRASKFPLHRLGKLAAALHTTCDYLVTGKHPRATADEDDRRVA